MTVYISHAFPNGEVVDAALDKALTAVQPDMLTPLAADVADLKVFSFTPKKLRVGFAGDSIAQGLGKTSFQSSFLAWHLFGDYPLDIEWDSRLYSEGGYNFAIGGDGTADILAVQAPQIQARTPEILFVNGGTNDGVSTLVQADTAFGHLRDLINVALAAGVKSVLVYPIIPKASNNNSTNTVNAVSHFNTKLLTFCQSDRRLIYLNPDIYLADGTSKFHMPRSGVLADGTHLSGRGSFAQRRILEGIFPRAARRIFAGNPGNIWHATNNPIGNVLGGSGYFIEGGGTLNAVSNPGVGKEWVATTTSGLVATPSLVDSDVFPGFKCQRVEISGTASAASALIKFQRTYYNAAIFASETSWNFELYVRCKNFVNLPPPTVSLLTTGGSNPPVQYRLTGGSGVSLTANDCLSESDVILYFRNPGPIISNSSNRQFELAIEIGTVNGMSPTGTLEFGMVSIHPGAWR